MTQTIAKSIGEGHGKGELFAALAHDTSDKFGGMELKSICMNFATYDETTGDGRICFYDRNMYIAPYETNSLDIVAGADLWLFATDIFLVGTVHYAGGIHEEANVEFDVLLTGPSVAANALHGEIDATVPWASGGNLVGVRGKVDITAAGVTGSATGVWAGLTITSASVQRQGLQVGMNVEAYSNTICLPNAVLYIQSLPSGSTTDFSDTPYLVFSETVSGSATGSNILFEVGHEWALTVPTLEEDMLFWQDTLRIAVNKSAGSRTKFYIPLSTVTGTFTYAYLVALTNVETIDVTLTASLLSALAITTTSADTTGGSTVVKPLYVDAEMSADGGLGRAIEGKLTVSGKLGNYGNAIKGYIDFTGGTGCAGLASAICAEMKMPASTALGTHAVLEIELVMPASAVIQQGIGANCTSFIWARVSDDVSAVASFNEYGYFLNLQGLTSGDTDLFYENTLKCAIGSTKWYLLMSTAQGSFTTSRPIVSTSTVGYSNTAALDPDATRTNHAFAYGWRLEVNEVTATFENAADQNLEPIAINLNIAGADPSGDSTVNVIYQCLTHDTTAMPHIRLKQADWYISIKKNVLDVYNMQLETSFGAASITVGGEMAVLGLVLNGGTNAVACNSWRVINCTLRGSGTPSAFAHGIMVNAESSLVIDAGIMLQGDGMQVGVRIGTTSYAESPVHFAGFPEAGTQPVVSGADASGDVEGSIAIKIGAYTKYLHYWPNAS